MADAPAPSTPLIIEAALNGATPRSRNPHVPRSVDEIVAAAVACLDAGASIVHHHNDEPNFGGATRHAAEPYRAAWARIRARHPRALLYPTMAGAAPGSKVAERYAHVAELYQAGVLNMSMADPGSVNVAFPGPAGPAPTDHVYVNTCADFAYMAEWCRARRVAVSVSIFEPGFLRVALAHLAAGTLPPGTKIQLYFGGPWALFGLPPTALALDVYLSLLDASGLPWMVGTLGGDVAQGMAALAIARGGHVRVGLEDYAGPRQPRNEELVAEIVALARAHGRAVASCDQTRALLAVD